MESPGNLPSPQPHTKPRPCLPWAKCCETVTLGGTSSAAWDSCPCRLRSLGDGPCSPPACPQNCQRREVLTRKPFLGCLIHTPVIPHLSPGSPFVSLSPQGVIVCDSSSFNTSSHFHSPPISHPAALILPPVYSAPFWAVHLPPGSQLAYSQERPCYFLQDCSALPRYSPDTSLDPHTCFIH